MRILEPVCSVRIGIAAEHRRLMHIYKPLSFSWGRDPNQATSKYQVAVPQGFLPDWIETGVVWNPTTHLAYASSRKPPEVTSGRVGTLERVAATFASLEVRNLPKDYLWQEVDDVVANINVMEYNDFYGFRHYKNLHPNAKYYLALDSVEVFL